MGQLESIIDDLELKECTTLSNEDFMIAVTAEHWLTGAKNDPNYIQWVGSFNIATADNYTQTYFPLHICTDEDFDKFYPIAPNSAAKVA